MRAVDIAVRAERVGGGREKREMGESPSVSEVTKETFLVLLFGMRYFHFLIGKRCESRVLHVRWRGVWQVLRKGVFSPVAFRMGERANSCCVSRVR